MATDQQKKAALGCHTSALDVVKDGLLTIRDFRDIDQDQYLRFQASFFDRHRYTLDDLNRVLKDQGAYLALRDASASNTNNPFKYAPAVKIVSSCELSRIALDGEERVGFNTTGYHDERNNIVYLNACNTFRTAVSTLAHELDHAFTFSEDRKVFHEQYDSMAGRAYDVIRQGGQRERDERAFRIRLSEEMPAYLLGAKVDAELARKFGLGPVGGADVRICGNTQAFNDWAKFMQGSENISAYGTQVYSDAEVKDLQMQAGCR